MPDQKIKTLLIEDSGLMRILLSDLLRKDESISVVATAVNGREGVEKARALKPDVIITDMVMPQYDGLYVVQELMKDMPVPIILLSSLDRTNPRIFDALKEGAFDFIDKPQANEMNGGFRQLTRMVREASMTDYLRLQRNVRGKNTSDHTFEPRLNYDIIAIGASTGGPSAVEFIVSNIPANLAIPVVIAQHMPERFLESFAVRIRESTGQKVSVMRDGEPLLANHIYLAPGTSNVKIVLDGSSPSAKYVNTIYKEFNCPSIDCLFESVADIFGRRAAAAVLTGMGKDGSEGLQKIRHAGGLTLAQDERTSVVFGMPKAAWDSGAAKQLIPLNEIPTFLISAL